MSNIELSKEKQLKTEIEHKINELNKLIQENSNSISVCLRVVENKQWLEVKASYSVRL